MLAGAVSLFSGTALAQSTCTSNPTTTVNTTNGQWTLSPAVLTTYQTQVNPPIAADGSSNFPAKRGVIPVQFSLFTAPGPIAFQSIGSDGYSGYSVGTGSIYANDCSYLSFAPTTSFTFSQLTMLMATYTFSKGNCHGGALRWSVDLADGHIVYIYYGGDTAFWTDCTTSGSTTNQSGLNMINAAFDGQQPDTRYEDTTHGGVYVTYADVLGQEGSSQVTSVTLVLDAGWSGDDQALTLGNVNVSTSTSAGTGTSDTFSAPTGPATQTCTLPTAQIQVVKTSGLSQGTVNDVLSTSAADTTGYFRVASCNYMYNLDVSSLPGAGTYQVSAIINGNPASNPATFMLK
jgi:hypothetical protein